MRPLPLALAFALPALAGCLQDGAAPALDDELAIPLDWAELALPFGKEHDHEDRAQHRGLSTPNFQVVGYDPLFSPYYGGKPAGAYFCGDASATSDGRVLAVVESRSDVGFSLIDVTDSARPKWLGEFVMPTTHVYDLAVVPDGRHVVLVTSDVREAGLGVPGGGAGGSARLQWRSACSSGPVAVTGAEPDVVPRPMSILLIDVTNPAQPTLVDQQPLLGSGHSVFSTLIDGRTWVMATTTRYYSPTAAGAVPNKNELSFYEFYEVADGPNGARLSLVSAWKPPLGGASGQVLGPRGHDGWLAVHPGTGDLLAYAVGHDRFTVLDLTDARSPREIGRWEEGGPGREGFTGELHSVLPLPDLWDGRHYTLIGPEWAGPPEGLPSGIVWVLDTTDPTKPFEVAGWTLPSEVSWSGTFMFSNHYFGVHERTLFISMYHAGVWAIDLTPLGMSEWSLLPSVGVYLPDRDPPEAAAYPQRWAPTVEEALVLPDGTVLTFDGNTGLYALRFDAARPAPAPEPWPLAPKNG